MLVDPTTDSRQHLGVDPPFLQFISPGGSFDRQSRSGKFFSCLFSALHFDNTQSSNPWFSPIDTTRSYRIPDRLAYISRISPLVDPTAMTKYVPNPSPVIHWNKEQPWLPPRQPRALPQYRWRRHPPRWWVPGIHTYLFEPRSR